MHENKASKNTFKKSLNATSNVPQRSLSGLANNYLSNVDSISQEKNVESSLVSENNTYKTSPTSSKGQLRIQNSPPNSLPSDTPAWSHEGTINIGPAFFQTEHTKRSEILRHEYIHSMHQSRAPNDNSLGARQYAESIAHERVALSRQSLSRPAPSLLAFPVQTHKPWDKVYIGNAGIIGELVQGDLTLRIRMAYSEFGIADVFEHNKDLDMEVISKNDFAIYHCSKHPNKTLAATVKTLKQVMAQVEQLNKKIPATSTFRTKYIFIAKGATERYRTANGKGILFLTTTSLNTGIIDAAAHEAAHGIFEHHTTAGNTDSSKRIPDDLALNIATIFTKLRATKSALVPDKKFNSKAPPAYTDKDGNGAQPSGLIPIYDTVWSGEGGHPWVDVDEFFASAFAAYSQDKKLLEKIIDHYSKHDKTIKPIYNELFILFKKVGNPKALQSLTSPVNKKSAEAVLSRSSAPPDYTDPSSIAISDQFFFNPSSLIGPDKIKC